MVLSNCASRSQPVDIFARENCVLLRPSGPAGVPTTHVSLRTNCAIFHHIVSRSSVPDEDEHTTDMWHWMGRQQWATMGVLQTLTVLICVNFFLCKSLPQCGLLTVHISSAMLSFVFSLHVLTSLPQVPNQSTRLSLF